MRDALYWRCHGNYLLSLFTVRTHGCLGNCVNTHRSSFPYLTPFVLRVRVFSSPLSPPPPRPALGAPRTRLSRTSNRATFSYTLSYDALFLAVITSRRGKRWARKVWKRRDKRAMEKGTVRWTKRYGREIDIFPRTRGEKRTVFNEEWFVGTFWMITGATRGW